MIQQINNERKATDRQASDRLDPSERRFHVVMKFRCKTVYVKQC